MSPRRRWPRRVLLFVAAPLLNILVLVLVVWGALMTPWAGAKLKTAAERALRGSIRGELAVERLRLVGLTVSLRGVTLSTPEGERVARVDRLDARVKLLPLLRRTVALADAHLDGVELLLVEDSRGLNLARALASGQAPTPSAPEKAGPAWSVRIDSFLVTGAQADFRQRPEGRHAALALSRLGGRFALERGERLSAEVGGLGRLLAPTQGALRLHATAEDEPLGRALSARLDLAGLELTASGHVGRGDALDVELEKLLVPSRVARAFLPGYPLRAPLTLSGRLSGVGGALAFELRGKAKAARLRTSGQLDTRTSSSRGFLAELEHVDLSELLERGPKSDLALQVEGEGGGESLSTLHGRVRLSLPTSRVRGRPVGPIEAQASADRGAVTLSQLLVVLPGMKLTGSGHGTAKRVHFEGQLRATNLSLLLSTFGGVVEARTPRLAGAGQLQVTLDGPTSHPGLFAAGQASALAFEDKSVESLALKLQLPDVRRPLEAQAVLAARGLHVGAGRFDEVSARLSTRGRALEGSFQTTGLARVVLRVTGLLDADGDGLELSALELRYPEARWTLVAPAHVRFPEGSFSLDPLSIRSGAQEISASAHWQRSRIAAALEVQELDLADLPRALVPAAGALSGRLWLRASVKGTAEHPQVELTTALEDAGYRSLKGLWADVRARYAEQRLEGTLLARGLSTRLSGKFNLPLTALREGHRTPVSAQLVLAPTPLGPALCALGEAGLVGQACRGARPLLTGQVASQLTVSGNADAPALSIKVAADGLTAPGLPPASAALTVATDSDDRLGAQVKLSGGPGDAEATLTTRLTLAEAVESPPSGAALLALPVRLRAQATRVSLGRLHAAGLLPPEVSGALSFDADLSGPAGSPLGTVELAADQLSLPSMVPMAVSLKARSEATRIALALEARNARGALVSLTGAVRTPLSGLRHPASRAASPVELDGQLGPLELADLPLVTGQGRAARKLEGRLQGSLNVRGTWGDPQAHAELHAAQALVGESELGAAELRYDYATGLHAAHLALSSPGGGPLEIEARMARPLEPGGVPLEQAPIQISVRAKQFELGTLSRLLPGIRRVQGRLGANLTVAGSLGAPSLQGDLDLQLSALALEGFGTYDQVRLGLSAGPGGVTVRELSARSQGGTLRLVGDARGSGDHLQLAGHAELDRFPIVTDDQLRATLTLKTTVQGSTDPTQVSLSARVPEAHVRLPDAAPKNLEPLSPPPDIILVRQGKPLHARAAPAREQKVGGPSGSAQLRTYSVTLAAPRNLWIEGSNVEGQSSDVQLEVGLSEGFRVELAPELLVFGEVRVLRGRVDALGRRFDVQRNSTVRFSGPPDQPALAVTAVYNDVRDGIKVSLNVHGQGKDITLKPSSEPPLSDQEIYTLLATGRTTLKRDSGAASASPFSSSQAVTVLGSLVAAQLKKTLSAKLPLDVLSIQSGEATSTTGITGSVEAGKYFGDKLYIGYQGRLGADPTRYENSNSVRVEYQFSPRWSADAEYGDARQGAVDLIWSRDY